VRSDRCVHARMHNGIEVVRYDRAGKWYEEHPDGSRKKPTLGQAVNDAALPGVTVIFGLPGGSMFDDWVRALRGGGQP